MPPRYTSENVSKTIKSISDVIELHKKQNKNYNDMENSLERIQIAMNPDFDKMLKEILNNKIDQVYTEKTKEDPNYSRSTCGMLARQRIMRESKFFQSNETFPRWEDFKWQFKRIWENDRARLIQKGEIKGEIIKNRNFEIVKFTQMKNHNNLSAEFWVNHDEKNCKICKKVRNKND